MSDRGRNSRSAEFQDILVRASMLLDGVGVVDAHIGDTMMAQVQRFQKAIPAK